MARVRVCSACGGENPTDEIICVACGSSIIDVEPSQQQTSADRELPPMQTGGARPTGTVREPSLAGRAELVFPWGSVTVRDRLHIGRDDSFSPLATQLAPHDTVSRRHAELYFDNGVLFVRHLGMTNSTYVNDRPLDTNESTRINDGDTIGFSRAVVATVRFGALR